MRLYVVKGLNKLRSVRFWSGSESYRESLRDSFPYEAIAGIN